ncbi:hypothetical protein JHK85_025732 [Glycine max]|nr:hypothetical protein JHK85_025732 [Glycine max]
MMAQKPKPENNSAAYFEPGSAVEVRTHGGLFRGSWFSGTIISRDASDRFLQVEYHNHHNVREFVSLHQLRPLLPPETRHRKFESGEKVSVGGSGTKFFGFVFVVSRRGFSDEDGENESM